MLPIAREDVKGWGEPLYSNYELYWLKQCKHQVKLFSKKPPQYSGGGQVGQY